MEGIKDIYLFNIVNNFMIEDKIHWSHYVRVCTDGACQRQAVMVACKYSSAEERKMLLVTNVLSKGNT